MARPNKIGLDYFPLDVDIFEDEKIVAISGEFGIKGEITVIKLLCAIYRNGYFTLWNDLFKFKLARTLPGISPELIESIVYRLVRWGFFDKSLFDSVEVLTSKGIQKRYFEASKRRKITRDLPYLLIDEVCGCEGDEALSSVDGLRNARSTVSGCGVNVYNNGVNVCNNSPLGDSETSSTYGKNSSASVNVCKNRVNVYNNSVNVCKNTTNKRKEKEIKENTPYGVSKKAADAAGLQADPSNPPCPAGGETPPPGSAPPPSPKRKVFRKPTVDEIRAYCAERHNSVDAEHFYDHYEANGWKIGGKSPMKDWRAAVRTWEKNNAIYGRKEQQKFGNTRPGDFAGKGYTDI